MRSTPVLALEELEAEAIEKLADQDLARSIEEERRAIDRLEADFSRRLARFHASRGFEATGALDTVSRLKRHGRLSAGAAAERVRVAASMDALPLMAKAFGDGQISFSQAAVIARAAGDVGVESAPEMEELAVHAAATLDPGQLRRFTDRLSYDLNRAAFAANQRLAHERRRLDLSRGPDGMWSMDGRFDDEAGAYISTALEAVLGPRSRDDRRTAAQRRADALVDVARGHLEGRGRVRGSGGQRPHSTVTATIQALQGEPGAPPGLVAGQFPVTPDTLRRIACDCALTPILVEDSGEPLDFGRTMRTASAALRRAVVLAAGGHCEFPGCDRRAEWCDVHHLDDWVNGGSTSRRRCALLCRRHHRLLHEGGWRLDRSADGRVVATPPKATAVGPAP